MSIIRELVTRLSFKVDKNGLEKFEKSIFGFKTKIAAAGAAISALVYKTTQYFANLSKTITETQDLAKSTQTATQQVIALQQAFDDLGLPTQKFNSYFKEISDLLYEARSGRGKLFDIQIDTRGKLNLTPFIQSGDTEGAFKAVLDYVNQLENRKAKEQALQGIFSENAPGDLLRALDKGTDALNSAIERNEAYANQLTKVADDATRLKDNLNLMGNEFKRQTDTILTLFIPGLAKATESWIESIQKIDAAGFIRTTVHNFETNVTQPLKRFFGGIYDFVTELPSDVTKFLSPVENRNFVEEEQARLGYSTQAPITITNNVEVTVPPGTDEQRAINTAALTKEAMQEFWDYNVREVVSNNPQVE